MVLSDETVQQLLNTLTKTLDEMRIVAKENSDLQKELMGFLREKTIAQKATTAPKNEDTSASKDGNTNFPRKSFRPKPNRPSIDSETDELNWIIFQDNWARFKLMADLQDEKEICLELRETCSAEVNRLLYQYKGADALNANNLKEKDLLSYIKIVAVKSIHKEVHRWHYGQIAQMDAEPAAQYIGRLKSRASLCAYKVQCECGKEVSYADEMVSQRLVAGLTNTEHQSRMLNEAENLPQLKDKVERLISLEATDDATSKFRTPEVVTVANAARSSAYKKNQQFRPTPILRGRSPTRIPRNKVSFRKRRCRGCGRSSHAGEEDKPLNRSSCPAMGKKCLECGGFNHFAKVCEKRKSRSSFAATDGESSCSSNECTEEEYENNNMERDPTTEDESYNFAARAGDFCPDHRQRPTS